jgi:hypothetical protein
MCPAGKNMKKLNVELVFEMVSKYFWFEIVGCFGGWADGWMDRWMGVKPGLRDGLAQSKI